jgi:hypothetical protein
MAHVELDITSKLNGFGLKKKNTSKGITPE